MLIDFHNHVLPGADDGSKSLEMSLSMLRTAAEQGITDVINTIHYQHPKMGDFAITNEDLQDRIAELQTEVDKAGIPIKLHQGAEVFYLPNLVELSKDPVTTIGNGKYMLVEFQLHQLPEGYRDVLFNLVMSGVTPIIAHPERYNPIQRDIDIIRDLIQAGCLIQIDGGSLTGSLGQSAKKAAVDILQQGLCHLIGSDAHDDRRRNFCLSESIDKAREIIGDAVDRIIHNSQKLLTGESIDTEINISYPVEYPSFFARVKKRI
ncbi:MAG: hypothetical protein H8E14_14540, partial [Candidatus Marinimicrobia bacterium]|nr:hypothetical protein [Candidatus Neomarinimicrobiota bacterium]